MDIREWEQKNMKDEELVKLINGLSEKSCLERKEISLYGNLYLTAIPPEIARFKNLEKLGVQGNNIIYSKVADELAQLVHLRQIYFASSLLGNNLKLIPKSIFSLINLTELILSKCNLTHVSPLIGKLVNLEILHLDENDIFSLPSEMVNLKKLETLCLQSNHYPKSFRLNIWSNYKNVQKILRKIYNFYSPREDKVRNLIIKSMVSLKRSIHKEIVPLIGKLLWETRQEKIWF
jgi:Leucine-rich repeat (LRR) protein